MDTLNEPGETFQPNMRLVARLVGEVWVGRLFWMQIFESGPQAGLSHVEMVAFLWASSPQKRHHFNQRAPKA